MEFGMVRAVWVHTAYVCLGVGGERPSKCLRNHFFGI